MTDTPTPFVSMPPAEETAPRRKRFGWRSGLRWFAAEFLVVVSGVLVALALNAWWSGQQSAAQEEVYLRQLAEELAQAETRFERSLDNTTTQLHTIQSLLVAFTAPDAADPDSIHLWLAQTASHNVPFLSLGVARGLASGDITVVRDDSIRTALFGFLEAANQYERYNGQAYTSFIAYSNQLREWSPIASRAATMHAANPGFMEGFYPVLPFGPDRRVAFSDEPAFLTDRDAHRTIDGLFDMVADMRVLQERMMREIQGMRGVLDRRGIKAPAEGSHD